MSPTSSGTRDGRALFFLLLSVAVSALEAFLVQTFSIHHVLNVESLWSTVTPSLLLIDVLAPLAWALLSRKLFLVFLVLQTAASSVILHYGSFFYNTLTLSTMYHSMQGLSYLGDAVFIFVRPDILLLLVPVLAVKLLFLRPAAGSPQSRPRRIVAAMVCLMVLSVVMFREHGRSGMLSLWTDEGPYRTTADRRSQEGTRESVRHLGYLATWVGEWLGGVYKDTSLIYAERKCRDPQTAFLERHPEGGGTWCGWPLPPVTGPVVAVQVESLDFSALSMTFNGRAVMPFLRSLLPDSVLLRAFAPHKVGSANADYELLNGREADQNVMYYSYIRDYPDSVIHALKDRHPAAFHGLEGNLFNLREAYGLMGFSETFFKEELVRQGYPVSDLAMEHVADEHVLDAAAKYLEQGRGQAVFVVTMSTHIPFMEPLPEFGQGRGLFARYIASLHYADACLADFYARLPVGTLFVLWGDHAGDVPYPPGMADNGRLVPFLVNVRGGSGWITGTGEDHPFTLCELSFYLKRLLRDHD